MCSATGNRGPKGTADDDDVSEDKPIASADKVSGAPADKTSAVSADKHLSCQQTKHPKSWRLWEPSRAFFGPSGTLFEFSRALFEPPRSLFGPYWTHVAQHNSHQPGFGPQAHIGPSGTIWSNWPHWLHSNPFGRIGPIELAPPLRQSRTRS